MAFLPGRGRIAVLPLAGTLGSGIRPTVYVPLLESAAKSRRIRALVLDIDSGGGLVSASEELYTAVSRVAKNKPVVAYIRSVGASGAYYVSCAAQHIVALPSALVGSIGVIYLRPVIGELLQRFGVSMAVYKTGQFKDMTSPFRPPTPEEGERFQGLVNELFQDFLQVVAKARKLDMAKVQEYATGEVFTARKAKEMGLVDELGDLDTALEKAAQLARIKRRVVYLRPRRRFMQRLLGGFAEDLTFSLTAEIEARLTGQVLYEWDNSHSQLP